MSLKNQKNYLCIKQHSSKPCATGTWIFGQNTQVFGLERVIKIENIIFRTKQEHWNRQRDKLHCTCIGVIGQRRRYRTKTVKKPQRTLRGQCRQFYNSLYYIYRVLIPIFFSYRKNMPKSPRQASTNISRIRRLICIHLVWHSRSAFLKEAVSSCL